MPGCFVDQKVEPELNGITNAIISAAIDMHRALGRFHLESAHGANREATTNALTPPPWPPVLSVSRWLHFPCESGVTSPAR
jgi:hypothetical protein